MSEEQKQKLPAKRKVASFLRKCAKYLEVYGWHRGRMYAHGGSNPPACIIGCVYAVDGQDICAPTSDMAKAAMAALGVQLYIDGHPDSLAQYNDFTCQSVNEMVDFIRRAARGLDHGMKLYKSRDCDEYYHDVTFSL